MNIPSFAKLKAEEPYVGPENISEMFNKISFNQFETNIDRIIEKINSKKIKCTAAGCPSNVSIINRNFCQHCDSVFCILHRPMLNHNCQININKTPRRFPIALETIKEARERAADLVIKKKGTIRVQKEKKKVFAIDEIVKEFDN